MRSGAKLGRGLLLRSPAAYNRRVSMPDIRIGGIVFDCHDPLKVAEFWQAVTGFTPEWEQPFVPDPAGDDWFALKDPAGGQPNLGFQRVPESKVVKNRVHIDLYTRDEEEAADRIVGLGATRLWRSTNPDDPFIVLGDPEGNEFCLVRSGSGS
jgi:catechol 2,3-dioxygenase-like lactoylglutathione lyase family enzyme